MDVLMPNIISTIGQNKPEGRQPGRGGQAAHGVLKYLFKGLSPDPLSASHGGAGLQEVQFTCFGSGIIGLRGISG